MSDPAGVAVLADARCSDIHDRHWTAMRRSAPEGMRRSCDSCTGWAKHVAAALAPLFAERERAAAEAAWDECIRGIAWCLDNGPSGAAPDYLLHHNPYCADALAQKVPQGSQEGAGGSNTRSVALGDADDENGAQNGADEVGA